jgi:Uma2 family endonuclease
MSLKTKQLTYEDYLAMPEIKRRYEIVDGELSVPPSPTPAHQWISANLFRALDRFIREHRLGVLFYAPLDVLIRKSPLRTRQPDLLFLRTERSGITSSVQLREMPVLSQAPDLVVEILSPSNSRRKVSNKLEDYRSIGVRECWIVSPETQTVEVIRLSTAGREVLNVFSPGMLIHSAVLEGLTLPVEEVFAWPTCSG